MTCVVTLRPLAGSDSEQLRFWRCSPEVAGYMTTPGPATVEAHEAWFKGAVRDASARYWMVAANGMDVGLASINRIDHENRHAEWAFYLGDVQARGSGFGTAIELFVLGYAFEVLRLHKLMGQVLAFNESVLAMHLRYGFRREGCLREHVKRGSEYVDMVLISILESEWPGAKDRLRDRLRARNLTLSDYLAESARCFDD